MCGCGPYCACAAYAVRRWCTRAEHVHVLVCAGGDFNQPAARDYPPEEWAAMAQDMQDGDRQIGRLDSGAHRQPGRLGRQGGR